MDWISNLPDSLLCEILSDLSTKQSIRTSVLSKRWRNLWLHVPALDLNSNEFPTGNDDDNLVIDFVEKFLGSDDKQELKRFKLIYSVNTGFRFESWINAAVNRKIYHLHVHTDMEIVRLARMRLSLSLCKSLVNLRLYRVFLHLPEESVFSLPCLKIMHLEMIVYYELTLVTLVSSFLEDLTRVRTNDSYLEDVCIRSKSLKSFKLESMYDQCYHVEIDAPKLESLTLKDYFTESFVIHSIGPFAIADIGVTFGVDYLEELDRNDFSKITMIGEFLTALSTVSDFTISDATIEVIRAYSVVRKLPEFSNLSRLHVKFFEVFQITMLPILFKSCPNLQSLVLEFVCFLDMDYFSPVTKNFISSSLEFVHLKTPHVMPNDGDPECPKMELAKFFLDNVVALKKLTLGPGFCGIINEIKSIPRSSTSCQIVID